MNTIQIMREDARYRELSGAEFRSFINGDDVPFVVALVSGRGFVVDTWK